MANPQIFFAKGGKIRIEKGPLSGPDTPQFNVRFLSPLGNKSWGTYGYLMQTSGAETSIPK